MATVHNLLALNDPDPKEMTVVEHLDELRRRLMICIAVVTVGSVIGWFVHAGAFHLLVVPLAPFLATTKHSIGAVLTLTKITDGFVIPLKISIAVGIALGLPVLLYQTWMFVAPAVSLQARRYAVPFVLLGLLLFIMGSVVGYAVFPRVVSFLVYMGNSLEGTQFFLNVSDYVAQFALVIIVFGAVFELPVVLTFLAMVGVVSSRFLRKKRRYAAMLGLIVAMVITPGADPITPFITAAVVYVLYEFSIIMVRLIHR